MEPILRDSLLLSFCWILPLFLTIALLSRFIIWILKISTRKLRKRLTFLQRMADRIKFSRMSFTFFKSKISSLAFFSIYVALLVTVTIFFFSTYFYSRPFIASKSIEDHSTYANESNGIKVIFDRPFNKKRLKVLTAPENIGTRLEYDSPFSPILDYIEKTTGIELEPPYYTQIIIYPANSIPYESGFVFYISDLASASLVGGFHEYPITLSTPDFPKIKGTFPNNDDVDFPIDDSIKVAFSAPITGSLKTQIVSEPKTNGTFIKTGEKSGEIHFDKKLEQGTKYSFSIITKEQQINLKTKKQISERDEEFEYNFEFTTVTPAGIKSIKPKGESVHPSSKFTLTFTEAMDTDSVENNITITPEIEYESSWDDSNTIFTVIPKEKLKRATKFEISLSTDVMTQKKGTLENEIHHKFETLGYVKISGFSPRNGSTGNSTWTPIAIAFDQAVDHASAQSHISISPKASVKYSWNGNKLTMYPKSSLAYSRKYTIKISPGVKSIEGLDSKTTFQYTFSTRSQVVTINVPRYIQPGSYDCNLTATTMALKAKGVTVSVNAVRAGVGSGTPYNKSTLTGGNPNANWIANYGVHWGPIANYVRSKGRGATVKSGWTTAGIAHEIQKGNPVIIWWYNGVSSQTMNSWYSSVGGRPGMHSVVVYGFKGSENAPTHLYVKDPWYSYSYYSAGTFIAKWNYLGRKAVIVQ